MSLLITFSTLSPLTVVSYLSSPFAFIYQSPWCRMLAVCLSRTSSCSIAVQTVSFHLFLESPNIFRSHQIPTTCLENTAQKHDKPPSTVCFCKGLHSFNISKHKLILFLHLFCTNSLFYRILSFPPFGPNYFSLLSCIHWNLFFTPKL